MPKNLWDQKLSNLKVLVVDDELVIRSMIEYSLQAMSIKDITLAVDGAKAFDILETAATPFDLVICDWMMPVMDGINFVKKVRAMEYNTKILMLTGKATADAVREAISAGANSYVVKPFTADDLYGKIRTVLKDPEKNS